jgi:hypothetical protein
VTPSGCFLHRMGNRRAKASEKDCLPTCGLLAEAGLPAIFLPGCGCAKPTRWELHQHGGTAFTVKLLARIPPINHPCICVLPPVTFAPAWPPTLAKLVAVALLLFFSFVKRPSPLSLLLLPAFSRYPTIVSLSELCFSTCLSRELCRPSSVSDPFRPRQRQTPSHAVLGLWLEY